MSSGSASGYNRLAGVYAGLERIAFGDLLMQARLCLLGRLEPPQRVLIVGEGDGRFLQALLARYPDVQVAVLEQSSKMIASAKGRLTGKTGVRWYQQNVTDFRPAPDTYDTVVTTFILDSFEGETLTNLVAHLVDGLTLGGQWYYSDFHQPATGWAKWRARAWLWLLYTFFGFQTGLTVKRLENPSPLLERSGLVQTAEQYLSNGLLLTRLYKKV